MDLTSTIKIVVALTFAAALAGQLPRATQVIRTAQARLLVESRASRWVSPDLLFRSPPNFRKSGRLFYQ